MKFVDLQSEYTHFKKEIDSKLSSVCQSGWYLFGNELTTLEKSFTNLTNKKNAIAVKNCTDAIMLVLKSVWKPSMPIILPNFGAYPTAVACKNITDDLYFVDVDDSLTINASKLPNLKNGIVIVVHLFGNNCDMDNIVKYCRDNNHILIEDCAQSTGAGSGKLGDYSVFSFYPTKPLASMGDGGMICCDDDRVAFDRLRFYGQAGAEIHSVGINSRMDEFQAGIVNVKFNHFNGLNDKRKEICNRYKKIVNGFKVNGNCVFHQFVLLFNERNEVIKEFDKAKVPYIIHYPNHISDMEIFKDALYTKVGTKINDKCISVPCHPFMSESEIQQVESLLYSVKRYEYIW